MIAARAVDDEIIPPVAARENVIARCLKRRLERNAAVGAFPCKARVRLHRLRVDAAFRAPEDFVFLRAAFGPLKIPVGHQHAFAALEVEPDFELARRAFVDLRRERIRNRPPALHVDAEGDDMEMHAARLLMLHHKMRLAGEAEIFQQKLFRLVPLRGREMLMIARIDVGLIEVVFRPAAAVARQNFHLMHQVGNCRRVEAHDFRQRHPLVLLGVFEVLGPPAARAAAAAVNDHRSRIARQAPASARRWPCGVR